MISVEKCIDERYADPSNRYPLLDSVQAIVADTIYETNNAIETGQKEALNVIAKIKQVYNILDSLKKDMQWLEKQLIPFKIKPEEALIVTIDGKNQIFCQKKEGK